MCPQGAQNAHIVHQVHHDGDYRNYSITDCNQEAKKESVNTNQLLQGEHITKEMNQDIDATEMDPEGNKCLPNRL